LQCAPVAVPTVISEAGVLDGVAQPGGYVGSNHAYEAQPVRTGAVQGRLPDDPGTDWRFLDALAQKVGPCRAQRIVELFRPLWQGRRMRLHRAHRLPDLEIGRASWRERV